VEVYQLLTDNARTNIVYCATDQGIFSLSEDIPVTETDDYQNRPSTFELSQNYPNPFNPTTLIRYQIPAVAHVTMRLYNLIGQQVAELVNETQGIGRYQVTLDASTLPSGIYFYRITAGNFTETKKLTLLR
jgi:hypothetical protein